MEKYKRGKRWKGMEKYKRGESKEKLGEDLD
jgi:hypothetical protein